MGLASLASTNAAQAQAASPAAMRETMAVGDEPGRVSTEEVIIREGRGSCSLLQRALGIGYGRAARLIDFMAEDGIVGEYKSGSAREVLYSWDEWEALKNGGATPSSAA